MLTFASVITLASIIIFFTLYEPEVNQPVITEKEIAPSPSPKQNILVDLAGSVEKPDVYEITSGARLKDMMILAGGLSADADRTFFSRYFNLAETLYDQEKIYIPSSYEVINNLVNQSIIKSFYLSESKSSSKKININTASLEELDLLPEVGQTIAQKIVQNRPYNSLQELIDKKALRSNALEKIKEQIEL